jgi:hypothetical protein
VGENQTAPEQRRVTVAEAARLLGISAEAVRTRIRRGKFRSIKEGGTVYVLLDQPEPHQTQTEHGPDTDQTDELLAELRDQVRFLREELARKDAILLRMAESIQQLEAPSEPPKAPQTATEQPDRVEGPATGDAQEDAQRPWWRRMFGG